LKSLPLRWTGSDPCMGSGFLRSLLENNLDDDDVMTRGVNWRTVCGLALSFAISAGFWAGLGVIVSRLT
jgi:hypothetical protein